VSPTAEKVTIETSLELRELYREREHIEYFKYSSLVDSDTRQKFNSRVKQITRILNKAVVIVLFLVLTSSVARAEQLKASWYSTESLKKEGTWKYSKGVMANGKAFNDQCFTCASWDYPLGSILRIQHMDIYGRSRTVSVRVCDRTARRFKGERIDLSKGAFAAIAPLKSGLVPVIVEVIQ
jgi:rare lipoprotein A (peptidoglycan hydrolase)